MSSADHQLLKDVDDTKETWRIKVKVWRRWTVRNQNSSSNFSSISMVLVDEQGSKIQALVGNSSLVEIFHREPIEGKCYIIKNFSVSDNKAQYRPTSHPYRINFNLCTHVEPVHMALPNHFHSFVPISDIVNGRASTDVLIDVLGFLKTFGNLDEFNKNHQSHHRLCFSLADHEDNSVNVVLFGECAYDAYCSKEEDMEPPIIVVLELARLKFNNGFIELANSWSATRVLFNPYIPQATDLINRLPLSTTNQNVTFTQEVLPYQSPTIPTNILTFPRRYSINQLLAKCESTTAVILTTIKKVETNFGWMYEGCAQCSSKPKMKNNISHCFGCKKNCPDIEPKFRVYYSVSDHTGTTSVVFFDRLAKKLLEVSAKELKHKLDQNNRPYSFPRELEKLVNQQIIMKVKLDEQNINKKFSTCTVLDCEIDPNIMERFTYSIVDNSSVSTSDVISSSIGHGLDSPMEDSEPICSTPIGSCASQNGAASDNIAIDDMTIAEFVTPIQSKAKGKAHGKRITDEERAIGLGDMSTPHFSTTKPSKIIKQEKQD